MIVAAAVCPHPPLLFRELGGPQDLVADLRAACHCAVEAMTSVSPELVLVVGGAAEPGSWDASLPAPVSRFGAPNRPGRPELPLSLGVGKRLLQETGWSGPVEMVAIEWTTPPEEVAQVAEKLAVRSERIALLVMGDGSARRGEKGPGFTGYVDDRSLGFDEAVGRALAAADADSLWRMDAALAEELMVAGRAAFQVLASVVRLQGSRPKAALMYHDDPFGVMYFVALWERLDGPGSSIS